MAKQKAYVRINSSERCWYEIVEFEVSDDLYAKINEAVENNIPLADCDFADELYELAENSLNLDEIVEPDNYRHKYQSNGFAVSGFPF